MYSLQVGNLPFFVLLALPRHVCTRNKQNKDCVPAAGGVPGRLQAPPDAPAVQLFFSNPDVVFSNEFPAPRFGQGAFAAALMAVHEAVRCSVAR